MKDFRISNKGTTRLFKNNHLEKLTRTHFLVPVILFYVIPIVCIYYAAAFTSLNLWKLTYMFPLGMITFSLVEYLIHRYIFHFTPSTIKEENLQYSIHGVHHEFPRDKDRLVMPPLISISVAILFFFIFFVLTGQNVWLIFSGFSAGYSTYLIIHYSVHRFKPPSNFLRYLWKHHSLHHYHSTESAFSVSLPLWDHVFGTMPKHKSSEDVHSENKLPDSLT